MKSKKKKEFFEAVAILGMFAVGLSLIALGLAILNIAFGLIFVGIVSIIFSLIPIFNSKPLTNEKNN